MLSNIRLQMSEYERLPPEEGGNCAPDSYLPNRFDTNIFKITKETVYSKEVEALIYYAFIIFNHMLFPLSSPSFRYVRNFA